MLGVSGAPFFAMLVFVCSFIPLLGVLLSTMPMGIVALGEFGVYKMAQVPQLCFVCECLCVCVCRFVHVMYLGMTHACVCAAFWHAGVCRQAGIMLSVSRCAALCGGGGGAWFPRILVCVRGVIICMFAGAHMSASSKTRTTRIDV